MDTHSIILYICTGIVIIGLLVNIRLFLNERESPTPWERHIKWMCERPWSWRDAILLVFFLIGLYMILICLQSVASIFHIMSDKKTAWPYWIVAGSITFHWASFAFISRLVYRKPLSWKAALGIDLYTLKEDIKKGVIFYLAMMPFFVFYSFLYRTWLHEIGISPVPQEITELIPQLQSSPLLFGYIVCVAVFIAPIAEEIVFRGIVLPLMIKKWGAIPGMIIVSLCFAAIHHNLGTLVPLFILAVAFSLAYLYTQSIVTPIIMHMIFNAMSLLIILNING
ncbi:MAG: CPBP family intramembrane metalloprotease [Kiritimatiellae bacterium]|nr:CPBP family intramembrane metalloprotease [Kiritimatiellia bacterium]